MPERADALFEHLNKKAKWPIDIYLIDNGSDIKSPSKYTNIYIKNNIQTCRGWLKGIEEAKKSKKKYLAYMFLITSANFTGEACPITPMASFLIRNPDAVGIHPALTKDSTTAWEHLITRKIKYPRKTWMIDNIASVYRRDWFDSIGWFDKDLIYAWGIDVETCYLARRQNRSIWVDERVLVRKITDIGYKMKRMRMDAKRRRELAWVNTNEVLSKKYGWDFWTKLTQDHIDESMR